MDNDSISVRFTDIDEPIKSRNLLSLSNSHRTGSILKKNTNSSSRITTPLLNPLRDLSILVEHKFSYNVYFIFY